MAVAAKVVLTVVAVMTKAVKKAAMVAAMVVVAATATVTVIFVPTTIHPRFRVESFSKILKDNPGSPTRTISKIQLFKKGTSLK